MAVVPDLSGNRANNTQTVDVSYDKKNFTLQLASNLTLAAATAGPLFTRIPAGAYIWDSIFTGTSLTLRSIAPDGVSTETILNNTTSGTPQKIVIGRDATIQLYNPNGTSVTGIYSNLS